MGEVSRQSGHEALEEYGWGEKDPLTGLYEGYDIPKGVLKPEGVTVSTLDLLRNWALVEFTFHSALGIDLAEVWRVKTWRWFMVRVSGLLSTDTPLARFFAPQDETPKPEVPDGR